MWRMVSVWLFAFAVLLATPYSTQVLAQDANDQLRGFLEELLQPRQSNRNTQAEQSPNATRRVPFGREEIQLSFAPLVERTAPSVVNVYAARTVQTRRSPFEGDPFFEQFFGDSFGRSQPRVQSSLGSGVIVDSSGLVVTNNHVIQQADQIKVALSDGREFESEVVLRDERSDLAVLRIRTGEALPALAFAESDQLQTGDLVLAIGNPFGVVQTITSGIVSAVARTRVGVSDFGFFIQTDAAINPGNSGGALIDMSGRLVGINTAIFTRSGGSNGIGFAIPANMVRAVVDQAIGGSDAFERPYMGATFDEVTADIAESLGMRRPAGAIVIDVANGGPADKAGLRVGDVVLSINDQRIEHVDALGYRLATLPVGSKVELDVFSRGELVSVRMTLSSPPKDSVLKTVSLEGRSPFAGAVVANITSDLRRQLKLSQRAQGVVIVEIQRGSPANRAGFRPADVIESVNGTTIEDVNVMRQVVADGGRSWRFRLNRGGRKIQQFLRF